jgi:hypothetical protein
LSGVNWEGIIARRDWFSVIVFEKIDNGCNVNLFLL